MSYMADQHSHSEYSSDSQSRINDMCDRAIELGISELAITDHCDINTHPMLRRLQRPLDADAAFEAMCKAEEEYRGRLKITKGIELGQVHDDPGEAGRILAAHEYDQVIGSLHNLKGMPDFYLFAYYEIGSTLSSAFFEQYLVELKEIVKIGCFDTLAHLTYPLRYFKKCNVEINIEPFIPQITEIFKMIIDKGIALEINASGYRQNHGGPIPTYDLVKLYYDLGGRYITVGADGHAPDQIGTNIEKVYENAKAIGFKHICSFEKRQMKLIEI